MRETKDKTPRYTGAYNRMFPVKVSTNSLVTIYVLHLLSEKRRYGKALINCISERFKGQWTPSHGLIYPILRELEKEKLVKGKWMGGKDKKTVRVYEITDKGREAYVLEKNRHKSMFAASYSVMEMLMTDLYDDEPMLWLDDAGQNDQVELSESGVMITEPALVQ